MCKFSERKGRVGFTVRLADTVRIGLVRIGKVILGKVNLGKFDYNNRMITLAVNTISSFHCSNHSADGPK